MPTGRVPGLDKWTRREWHKAAARERWSEGRKTRWEDWRRGLSREPGRDDGHRPKHVPVAEPKVWVKGRAPKEFADWVERHWSQDDETRAIVSECRIEACEKQRCRDPEQLIQSLRWPELTW